MKTIILEKETIYSGNLLLVNAVHPLRKPNTDGLIPVDMCYPDILLKHDAVNVLHLILEKISSGASIIPVSGYRSEDEQTQIYNESLKDNGEQFTKQFVALPNHSEHQTGLAIDLALNQKEIDFICPDFPNAGICQKFRKTAPDYGFIERYKADKEAMTGISHEPWHFRYVGYPHSKIIEQNQLSFEEYIEFIKDYPENNRLVFQEKGKAEMEVYFVPAAANQNFINLPRHAVYQISGNNEDGFIITIWRKTK